MTGREDLGGQGFFQVVRSFFITDLYQDFTTHRYQGLSYKTDHDSAMFPSGRSYTSDILTDKTSHLVTIVNRGVLT